MTATHRGTFTRVLPWAALGLMVVFFFMQVAARNRTEWSLKEAREQLQTSSAAAVVLPTADASGDAEVVRLAMRMRVAEERSVALRAREARLTARLEQTEAVRATQAALAVALTKERDAALAQHEALTLQLAEAGKATWSAQQEAQAARERADEAEHALRLSAEALRTLEMQAAKNQALIAKLSAAPRAPRGPDATIERWMDLVATDPASSAEAGKRLSAHADAVLDHFVGAGSANYRKNALAYGRVLAALPPHATVSAVARTLVSTGDLDPAVRRAFYTLARGHLADEASVRMVFWNGEPSTRELVLRDLKHSAKGWSAKQREAFVSLFVRALQHPKTSEKHADLARALGILAAPSATDALAARLADEKRDTRYAAAWALTQLKRSPKTVDPLRKHAKALLDSPDPKDKGEGVWLAQWVLGQTQNTGWINLSDAQLARVAGRLRARLDG